MAIVSIGSYTINSKDIDYLYTPEDSYYAMPHVVLKSGTKITLDYKDIDKTKKAMEEDEREVSIHRVMTMESNIL